MLTVSWLESRSMWIFYHYEWITTGLAMWIVLLLTCNLRCLSQWSLYLHERRRWRVRRCPTNWARVYQELHCGIAPCLTSASIDVHKRIRDLQSTRHPRCYHFRLMVDPSNHLHLHHPGKEKGEVNLWSYHFNSYLFPIFKHTTPIYEADQAKSQQNFFNLMKLIWN